jgi:hypothetical protein
MADGDPARAVDAERDASAELSLVVDWVDALNRSASEAPLTSERLIKVDATFRNQRSFEAAAAWYALPPEKRPLDPELTPSAVLDELEETTILVDVANEAQRDETYLVIFTASGTAHVAELSAGSHPASILHRPGEKWMLALTDDLDNFKDSVFTEVDTQFRSSTDRISVHISDLDTGSVVALSVDDYQARLQQRGSCTGRASRWLAARWSG